MANINYQSTLKSSINKSIRDRLPTISYKTQRKILLFSFLIVPLLLLCVFTLYPALQLFYLSFTYWDGFSPTKDWVGFSNYRDIFINPEMFSVFKTSLYYLGGGLLQLFLALYFAVLLNSKIRARNVFKSILFMPYIMNSVAIALIFTIFFSPEGTLNTILSLVGLDSLQHSWLGNSNLVNYALASTSIWRHMGLSLIIFLGVLQSIPKEIYEAAKIDGSSGWNTFRYITLPSIKKVFELNLILTVSGAISVFEIPFIMTKGANDSMTFVISTVDTAFKYSNFGLASAMSVILLLIVGTITLGQRLLLKERD
ncbi:carbohydrate ABC transporter permease [Peribacillus muralis]|uniref:carbohydrate ABC transporter permease n=1 Tax=Peribacillus muralis TaxID=264697 RepID=UPI0009E93977|nr:sugar ABC transporter permease [Peribacillus muralis]